MGWNLGWVGMLGGMTSWYHISSLMAPLVGWHLRWVDIPGEMAHWYGTPGGMESWYGTPGGSHPEWNGVSSGFAPGVGLRPWMGWHPG